MNEKIIDSGCLSYILRFSSRKYIKQITISGTRNLSLAVYLEVFVNNLFTVLT